MNIIDNGNNLILRDIKNFNSKHIFECGQCFRWESSNGKTYIGVVNGKVIELKQELEDVVFYNINMNEFNSYFKNYFDLERDYEVIKSSLSKDEILKEAIAFGDGIRILNQDIWECTISFILSANNRIPMIKRAIKNISKKFGEKIVYKNDEYYSFPTPNQLKDATIKDFEECGAGFRAKYLKNFADLVSNDKFNLGIIEKMSTNEGREYLQKLPGIGPKIADCVLLFSVKKSDVFPTDVWVKRVMEYFYSDKELKLNEIQKMATEKFADLCGFAQQYLFYYARELKIGK